VIGVVLAGGSNLRAAGFGLGAQAGLAIRLSDSAALELGAVYDRVFNRDIKRKLTAADEWVTVGRMEDWEFLSGFAAVNFRFPLR
jgi:hypothetical protein